MNPSKEHRKVEEQNRKIQKQEATITQLKRGRESRCPPQGAGVTNTKGEHPD
jgi:hypothetical protein